MTNPEKDLCKSMLKTKIGDYLARDAGGNNLTDQIIDELASAQLFGGDAPPGGFTKFVLGKGKNAVAKNLVENAVTGIISADWQQQKNQLNKVAWNTFKEKIGRDI